MIKVISLIICQVSFVYSFFKIYFTVASGLAGWWWLLPIAAAGGDRWRLQPPLTTAVLLILMNASLNDLPPAQEPSVQCCQHKKVVFLVVCCNFITSFVNKSKKNYQQPIFGCKKGNLGPWGPENGP